MTSSGARDPTPYDVLYPDYGDVESRVKSFTGWPGQVAGQHARVMAVSGLFYIGSADRVRCFSCGTTFRNWQPENDPLHVHRTVAPHCSFIRAITKNHAPRNLQASTTSGGDVRASGQESPKLGDNVGSSATTGSSAPFVGGSAASVVSGLDRGAFGRGVVTSRVQTTSTASGDICEDGPSGPAVVSISNNRGDNSRRDCSDWVASPGRELHSPAVLAVLEMGVARHTVEAVLRDRKSRGLQTPLTAVELYTACQHMTT